ncbi:MAG TPA: pyridoxal-phosphate dependent enzyme [Ignavibacteria bacterium]|nr:pyridoxal-phosphate dependent enzyme [Ignavibacteria bacterium]HQY51234.1 pyridoxal-phosphate dependent enzyme [Ignavibacteria bacterium]HRB01354.1 pyridoxal-phosphate dependent enzyme [Ignavibacteria bacterium]
MKYYNSVLDLIGNTPLVKLNNITKGLKPTVLAKMESYNPGGSVKDRIGLNMIEAAEREGKLKPGGTIIEATSGNTGIGIALVAALKGYKTIFVMTEKASREKNNYLKALGAEVIIQPMTAKHGEPDHYVTVAERLSKEIPNSLFLYQYVNPGNPEAHYKTTGPEIWNDTEGKITHFVSGVGTGGTISGTGKYLKEKNPGIKVIGADPYGSIFKVVKETGNTPEPIPYLIEGIGQDVMVENVQLQYIDEIVNVNDLDSVEMCKRLGKEEGIFCGGSTGTIAYAAVELAKTLDENAVIVFIVCDTGERYLSKYHSDEWLREKRLMNSDFISTGQVFLTKKTAGVPGLISAKSSDKLFEALELMDKYNLSTLPVIDGSDCVGSIAEESVIEKVMNDRNVSGKQVKDVMDKKLPIVDFNTEFPKALEMLQKDSTILVSQHGQIKGILTRYDVLDFV